MNLDNKKPGRKPLYVYYIIAAVIIILLNVLLLPAIEGRKVQTTDYSTFLTGFLLSRFIGFSSISFCYDVTYHLFISFSRKAR